MVNHRRSIELLAQEEQKHQLTANKRPNKVSSLLPTQSDSALTSPIESIDLKYTYRMSVNHFLNPYRECWSWLNEQGNHEAQLGLLRKLDQLPISKKKWLVHRICNSDSVTPVAFAEALTIVIYEQHQVDWNYIMSLIDYAEGKQEQEIALELESMGVDEVNQYPEMDSNQDDAGLGLNMLFIAGALTTSDDEQDKADSIETLLLSYQSAEQLSQLLFKQGLEEQPLVSQSPAEAMLMLLDGLFSLTLLRPDKRKQKREKLVQQYGFVSPIVFTKHSVELIVDKIYEQAIVKNDDNFRKLLYKFGFNASKLPSKEQLLNIFYRQYIG